MRKLFIIIIAVLMLAVTIGIATAVVEGPFTVISGQVTDENGAVDGAIVNVNCNGNDAEPVITGIDGMYYVSLSKAVCSVDDSVLVEASKDGAEGSNDGIVSYNGRCKINTSIVNVQIPEFGVLAGAAALVGALGIFLYRRK